MVSAGSIEETHRIFISISELGQYLSMDEMEKRLDSTYHPAVAVHEGALVGFKLGYPVGESEFYSRLGGIVPAYHNSGVAQSLLDFQEDWVKVSGFKSISVKSMNRFPSMMRLLLKNAYRIKNVESFGDSERERIQFIKML